MTNNSNTHANKVLADIAFFDYLKEKVGDRKTKTGAYYDLLDKASAGFIAPSQKKHEYALQDNQCHVTISDLAEDWHWHRATVRTFLDRLEEMGYINRTRFPKSMVITVSLAGTGNGNSSSSGIGQPSDELYDELHAALAKWVFDDLPDTDVGKVCGQCLDRLSNGPAGPVEDSVRKEIAGAIVSRVAMAAFQREIRKSRFDSTSAFMDFFDKEILSDWGELLDASKLLAELIIQGKNADIQASYQLQNTFLPLRKPFKALLAECLERRKGLF